MSKDLVELLNELKEVYKLTLERISHTCDITESDELFISVYEKYVFNKTSTKKEFLS